MIQLVVCPPEWRCMAEVEAISYCNFKIINNFTIALPINHGEKEVEI